MQEINEANALTVTGRADYLFARCSCLQLIQWWEETFLPKIFKVVGLDGGLGPVAVHFLQAHIVNFVRLLLSTPLDLRGTNFLPRCGGGLQLGGNGNGVWKRKKKEQEQKVRE